ncbi:MAG: hypothetical protein AAGD10_21555 [Myxococcota bacterium]
MELDLDITYVFAIALFLVPLLLLNFLVFRPFLAVFEERHDKLEGAIERADLMLAEAEEKAEAFNERIKEASLQGTERRDRSRREATTRMNERVEAERNRLGAKLEAAVQELESARDKAMSTVGEQARILAEETAARILGRQLT